MSVRALAQRKPVPMAATVAFFSALVATIVYFGGVFPGVSKTLPTFVSLVNLTAGIFVIAVIAWLVSVFVTDQN